MVNTGHPSRACKLCRSRRIKCDETKPHCLKCKKAKRQCPGYRDAFEINLRDETQSTIRKAKASAAAQKRADRVDRRESSAEDSPTASPPSTAGVLCTRTEQDSPYASEGSWECSSTWSTTSTDYTSVTTHESPTGLFMSPVSTDFVLNAPSVSHDLTFDFNSTWQTPTPNSSSSLTQMARAISSNFEGTRLQFGTSSSSHTDRTYLPSLSSGLQTPLNEQATCYFLSNFVLSLSSERGPSIFDFVLKIIRWDGINDTPFPMAFTAVSMAALAGRPNSRHLLFKSRIYYSVALAQLKDVLKDKDRAKKDTSLATTILLSFYEVSTFDVH